MAGIRQIGIIGNSIKTNALPIPSESTYETGNRFYTLTSAQDGYEVGHTYRTIINENNEYVWEDIETAGLKLAIPISEKGQPNGVAELNESGIVPEHQLPTIPTATSQLQNDSDFATNESVDEKLAGKANKDEIITDYNGFSNRPIINANLIGTSNPTTGTYYRHVGATNDTYTKGVIYYYDGEKYNALAGKERCVHFVEKSTFAVVDGTSTLSMKWTLDDIDGITEPIAGMMVAIQIPGTSIYGSGVVMSIDGGATYHPVLRNKVTALTLAYQEDVIVTFIYNPDLSVRAYLETGVQTTIAGCWQVADYDSDRTVQQTPSTSNTWLPILLKTNATDETATGLAYFSPDVKVNPNTGAIDVKEVFENGVSLADKYGDGSSSGMPVIRLVKVSDVDRTGVISPNNPLRVTIQVMSGAILPTDKIELCSKKAFTYKLYDESPDATRKKGRRWRLRRIAIKSAEECHPDKSVEAGQYRMICWEVGDNITPRAFLRSDNVYGARKWVTKYVRVSRTDSGGAVYHSNAVEFKFSVADIVKPDKNTAKIHLS